MNRDTNPALAYRELIRSVFRSFDPSHSSDEQKEFESWLKKFYGDATSQARSPTDSGTRRNTREDSLTLFVTAVGLLTYGALDYVSDILDNVPATPRNIRQLAWVLKAMLPLPENLDPLQDANAVKQWVITNRANLEWHSDNGRFVLKEPK